MGLGQLVYRKYYKCITCVLLFIASNFCYGQSLTKVELNDDNLLLLDIQLDRQTIVRSSDVYFSDEHQLFAIDSLFDALKIRYTISDSKLTIWKDEQSIEFELVDEQSDKDNVWASDGFYFFIDINLFKKIFNVDTKVSLSELRLNILTLGKFDFPIVKLRKSAVERARGQLSKDNTGKSAALMPITIEDQYRLATIPHGRVNIASNLDSKDNNTLIGSMQLTSDLLYHSANLTFSKSDKSDLKSNLVFSRYKTSPSKLILGAFDSYKWGDISGSSNELNAASSSGLGMSFHRKPANYRHSNSYVDIREVAPPGWEAELFRNQAYLDTKRVPADGQLLFEEVTVNYGANNFIIKLFGPFGEKRTITKTINLRQNALDEGQIAYSIFGLDKNHRLLENNDEYDYKMTDFGGRIDYGITDSWMLGLGYNSINNEHEFFNIKNAFSLPSLLVENNLSVADGSSYAQVTTVKGEIFSRDNFTFAFESSDNFDSDKVSTKNKEQQRYSVSYAMPRVGFSNSFNLSYASNDNSDMFTSSHGISSNLWRVSISHQLSYSETNYKGSSNGSFQKSHNNNISGALGLSGDIYKSLRISGLINYDPDYEDIILPSSNIKLDQTLNGFWKEKHYLTARFQPLLKNNASRWSLGYRVATYSDKYRLTLGSYYKENNDWGISLGLQFFVGYDHWNNKLMFSESLTPGVATLDVHTYLDRHLNGKPDVLDYNLSDVSFIGLNQWKEIRSGEGGRTILPGVGVNMQFPFAAKWQDGATTINRNYNIYTHAGAYVDVNMPFFLSTDLVGFVVRQKSGEEAGVRNAEVQLLDENLNVLKTQETDLDGYFEFNGLQPNTYTLRISQQYLSEKQYTGDVVGYKLTTGGQGGFVELPAINLTRKSSNGVSNSESISLFLINESNSEAVVWDDDEKIRQNYFTLPTNKAISAKYSLTQSIEEKSLKEKQDTVREKSSLQNDFIINQKIANPSLLQINSLSKKDLKKGGSLPTIRIHSVKELDAEPNDGSVTEPKYSQPLLKSTPLASTEKTVGFPKYTIQLASYNDNKKAEQFKKSLPLPQNEIKVIKTLNNAYKVIIGSFNSLEKGNAFASQKLPLNTNYFVRVRPKTVSDDKENKSINRTNKKWVIQLLASANKLELKNIDKQYHGLGKLFDATKVNSKGTVLHCLVSQGYATKQLAIAELASMGVKGWVNQSEKYNSITPLE